MGWTTLLLEAVGGFALLFVVLFPIVFSFVIGNYRLAPPRVRGLAPGEEPRYLELITEPARRRFEELGFSPAGYIATQPMMKAEREIVQLVMRNDQTRTLAYFYVRHPFREERPSAVGFESFLPDGTVFSTSARSMPVIGPRLPNRRRSGADDDQGIYRDHLATLVRRGLAAIELPTTFEGLLALNVNDAAWIWRTRLEQGVVVAAPAGGFRFGRWASLASVPKILWGQLANAIVEARRGRSDRAKGPVVDGRVPEIQQFLEERTRRRKEAAEAVSRKLKTSRGKTMTLWIAMVIGFTVFWQLLNHQLHWPSRRHPAGSTTSPLEPDDDAR